MTWLLLVSLPLSKMQRKRKMQAFGTKFELNWVLHHFPPKRHKSVEKGLRERKNTHGKETCKTRSLEDH